MSAVPALNALPFLNADDVADVARTRRRLEMESSGRTVGTMALRTRAEVGYRLHALLAGAAAPGPAIHAVDLEYGPGEVDAEETRDGLIVAVIRGSLGRFGENVIYRCVRIADELESNLLDPDADQIMLSDVLVPDMPRLPEMMTIMRVLRDTGVISATVCDRIHTVLVRENDESTGFFDDDSGMGEPDEWADDDMSDGGW